MNDTPVDQTPVIKGRSIVDEDVIAGKGAGPAIILVEPQMSENIGTAARAMGNVGLVDMRLVRPRLSHLDDKAISTASGADAILHQARVFDTLEEAVADLTTVYASTARRRDMVKRIVTPRVAATEIRAAYALPTPQPCGILFGRERTGLENSDVAIAQAVIEVPLNPSFCSLNLAQAVLLIGYEWFSAVDVTPPEQPVERGSTPATLGDLDGFYRHLETELDACGFLRLPAKRPGMINNIRSIFARAALTVQEVRTLHGIVTELRWGRRPDRHRRPEWGIGTPLTDGEDAVGTDHETSS